MEQVKEFRVKVQIKNNRLIRAREELGLLTQKAAAEAIGVSPFILSGLETFKDSPLGADGVWREAAIRISKFYGLSLDYLWSEAALQMRRSIAVKELGADEIKCLVASQPPPLPAPDQLYEEQELKQLMRGVLDRSNLTERERLVLDLRFGMNGKKEHTLDEAGAELGVCGGRVQQIEKRALKKLRHPRNSGVLRAYERAEPAVLPLKPVPWSKVVFVPIEERNRLIHNSWISDCNLFTEQRVLSEEGKTKKQVIEEANRIWPEKVNRQHIVPVLLGENTPWPVRELAEQYLAVNRLDWSDE